MKFACDFTVNRLVADNRNLHCRVARTYDCSSENLVFVIEIRVFVGVFPTIGYCDFLCLTAFAVEYGLVNLDVAVNDYAVCGYLIPRLQQNRVADNNIVYRDFNNFAVAVCFNHNPRGFFLQFLESVFIAVFRERGNQRREAYRDENSERLKPFGCALLDNSRIAEYRQYDVDKQCDDKYFYHRVAEIAFEFIPKALVRLLGHGVVAVFCFAFGNFLVC